MNHQIPPRAWILPNASRYTPNFPLPEGQLDHLLGCLQIHPVAYQRFEHLVCLTLALPYSEHFDLQQIAQLFCQLDDRLIAGQLDPVIDWPVPL